MKNSFFAFCLPWCTVVAVVVDGFCTYLGDDSVNLFNFEREIISRATQVFMNYICFARQILNLLIV